MLARFRRFSPNINESDVGSVEGSDAFCSVTAGVGAAATSGPDGALSLSTLDSLERGTKRTGEVVVWAASVGGDVFVGAVDDSSLFLFPFSVCRFGGGGEEGDVRLLVTDDNLLAFRTGKLDLTSGCADCESALLDAKEPKRDGAKMGLLAVASPSLLADN